MSGLDEQKIRKDIAIPEGRNAGKYPTYWLALSLNDVCMLWLRQKTGESTNYKSDFVLNTEFGNSIKEWTDEMYCWITSVQSVHPYGFASQDKVLIAKIVEQLKIAKQEGGIVGN